MRDAIPWCWDRFHHLYEGIFLLTVGYLIKNNIVMFVGIIFILDDVIEHTVTADTPIRLVYENFIKDKVSTCGCSI